MKVKITANKPRKENFGWEAPEFDYQGGWCIEGGEADYEQALVEWEAQQKTVIVDDEKENFDEDFHFAHMHQKNEKFDLKEQVKFKHDAPLGEDTETLLVVIREANLEAETSATLQDKFLPFFEAAASWKAQAAAIVVADETDTRTMKVAREMRLSLKDIRVAADKVRKLLKQDSLNYGKAVQSVYNVIEGLVSPIESYLQEQEDYAKNCELARQKKMAEDRGEMLLSYRRFVPASAYVSLGTMPEDEFQLLLNGAVLQEKAEAERIEREAAEAKRLAEEQEKAEKERKRIEAERIKADAEERKRLQDEAEKVREQMRLLKEQQAKEAEERRVAQEAEAQRIAEEKRITEAQRVAEEKRIAELQAEVKRVEDKRIAEKMKHDEELATLKKKSEQEFKKDDVVLTEDYLAELREREVETGFMAIAHEFLSSRGLMFCTRDWSAWSAKTMTDDDFVFAEDDEDFVRELATLIQNHSK